eukprot:970486-Pyramimonas_sp.AAC.1
MYVSDVRKPLAKYTWGEAIASDRSGPPTRRRDARPRREDTCRPGRPRHVPLLAGGRRRMGGWWCHC